MKRFIVLALCLALAAAVLSGCGGGETAEDSGKLKIVTTMFPEYDWVREILGSEAENVELSMLLDNGVDLHSYQPTAGDVVKISTCDLFIHAGGESASWVDAALAEAVNTEMLVVSQLEAPGVSVKEVETDRVLENEHGHGEDGEIDEHVWLSLKNAKLICAHIAEQLGVLDPENAALYAENAAALAAELDALDAEYRSAVESAELDTLLFADRFPFRYLTDDYGLNYYAAFPGCSAETEASFETVAFLAQKLDEEGSGSVLIIDGGSDELAKTIIQNSGAKNQDILSLDSMQSVTARDIADGKSYIGTMRSNLEVLRDALG